MFLGPIAQDTVVPVQVGLSDLASLTGSVGYVWSSKKKEILYYFADFLAL